MASGPMSSSGVTRCGMTPMEAIVAGTRTNARILHLDRMGTIVAGKEASFNVLDAILESITNTRRISTIYCAGRTRSAALGAGFIESVGRRPKGGSLI